MPVSQPVRLTAWFIIQTKALLRIKKSEINRADPLHKLLLPQAKQGFQLPSPTKQFRLPSPSHQTVPAPLPFPPNSSGFPLLPTKQSACPPVGQQCPLPYFSLSSFRCCYIVPRDTLSSYTKCSPPPP